MHIQGRIDTGGGASRMVKVFTYRCHPAALPPFGPLVQVDALTQIAHNFVPHHSAAALDEMRQTIDDVFTIPITAAARHAFILLLLDLIVGIPYRFLAAALIMVFTIFPFLDASIVLVPCWVIPLFLFGRAYS